MGRYRRSGTGSHAAGSLPSMADVSPKHNPREPLSVFKGLVCTIFFGLLRIVDFYVCQPFMVIQGKSS